MLLRDRFRDLCAPKATTTLCSMAYIRSKVLYSPLIIELSTRDFLHLASALYAIFNKDVKLLWDDMGDPDIHEDFRLVLDTVLTRICLDGYFPEFENRKFLKMYIQYIKKEEG